MPVNPLDRLLPDSYGEIERQRVKVEWAFRVIVDGESAAFRTMQLRVLPSLAYRKLLASHVGRLGRMLQFFQDAGFDPSSPPTTDADRDSIILAVAQRIVTSPD